MAAQRTRSVTRRSTMSTRPRRQHSGKQQPRIFAYLQYERIFARLLLIWAVVFNLYELAPEVTIRAPMLNDGVMHLLGFQRAVDALAVGQDPTDPWLATIDLGYPLFHFYQHLPFVVPALVYMPLRGLFSTADFFHWTIYLLLSIFPLSIYWSMRRFGFPRLAAAFSGLVASLVSTNGLYGFELGSYVWSGFGLYTQIWGMLLLPPALAQCYTTLRNGNGYFWAVLLLAASTLSHLVFGYIGLVSVVLFTFLPALQWPLRATLAELLWRRIKRLAILLALVGVVTAYFFVPLLQDAAYQNRTVWFPSTFYDSYGYQWVLGTLARGGLFDYNRFPTLTLLAAAGLVVCLRRWRRARYRVPVVLAVVWLLLYFGRSTWGVLMDFLVPMSGNVTLARFIEGVQLGGLYLIGLAIALPWLWAAIRRNYAALALLAGLTALLLFPVYQERVTYLSQNAQWMEQSKTAYEAQQKEVTALVTWLRQAPPGRVYAGLGAQWGRKYTVGAVPVY
ncbi:MAG: hypothetical protein JWO59_2973, partial [Chloroflexi bacterium]|nr:hypothetical protein [Chloroflexota bacterium]